MRVRMVVEVSRGSDQKFELDASGQLVLDRVVGMGYPVNYGFLPESLGLDGDPSDLLLLGPSLAPGSEVEVRVLGMLAMSDEKGSDAKFLAVLADDSRDFGDLSQGLLAKIEAFFASYK